MRCINISHNGHVIGFIWLSSDDLVCDFRLFLEKIVSGIVFVGVLHLTKTSTMTNITKIIDHSNITICHEKVISFLNGIIWNCDMIEVSAKLKSLCKIKRGNGNIIIRWFELDITIREVIRHLQIIDGSCKLASLHEPSNSEEETRVSRIFSLDIDTCKDTNPDITLDEPFFHLDTGNTSYVPIFYISLN